MRLAIGHVISNNVLYSDADQIFNHTYIEPQYVKPHSMYVVLMSRPLGMFPQEITRASDLLHGNIYTVTDMT